jgi:N-acetylated-alpha-linked acidic dipeptidase
MPPSPTAAERKPAVPISATERRFLDAVSLDLPWGLVETFSTMPRWLPEDVNRGADVIAQRLRGVGVPVEVHEPEIYLSIPLSASVAAGGVTYRAKPPSSALSVPEGRTAKLVRLTANPKALRSYNRDIATLFGGSIASLEEVKEKVGGKIVVMSGFGNPALTSLIEEWGGVGLIAVNPGVDIHWGTCTTIWGSPDLTDLARTPKIPVVAVNNPDGQKLMALAEQGGEATIRTEMQIGWFRQKIPVATIPGAKDQDSFVLVHGHYDSWDVGVGDNATGDATLMELSRVLWENRAALDRSVKLAWWPGHSTGRYAGSTWFTDKFALELDRHCVAQINCDSPGCRWATSYHETRVFAETAAIATAAIRDVVPDAVIKTMRPPQAGDYSFNNIGLPSFFMLSSTMPEALRKEKGYYDVSGCGANIAWHTENDTIEIADRDILLKDMRIYLLSTLRIANAEILPFDWVATCDEFLATIDSYETQSKGLADLSAARAATQKLKGALVKLGASRSVAPRNAVLQELSRILVPINYTREPRFRHDPAYTVPPLPTLAVAAELPGLSAEMRRFGELELMRGLNRYIAAIDAATRLVEGVPA